jgi:glucosyl-3-phosphoglycerate synthase
MQPHVRRWFDTRTYASDRWSAGDLARRKQGHRVAVVLPARNEEATVGGLVAQVRHDLVDRVGLVDEVVVMDSRSTDATARVAAAAGAAVHAVDDVLPTLGARPGKGEAMWKSLAVTSADLVVFLDADLREFSSQYVVGLLGPLLDHPEVDLVKAAYDRSLLLGAESSSTAGGRVTELTARPLLNAHWPDLAGVLQPLAGECAARRSVLEQVPFVCGYGVETGLLVDVLELRGLHALAQVDLGRRVHRNRPDDDLVATASAVVLAAARRSAPGRRVAPTVTRFVREDGRFVPVVVDVEEDERPPFATVTASALAALAS